MIDLAAIAAEFGDDPLGPSSFCHKGAVWRWTPRDGGAPAAWFFITIDGETAIAIRAAAGVRRGFGSVRVEARIGQSAFATSLFPAKEVKGYMLPLKAKVRKAEGLDEGSVVEVELTLA